MHLQSLLKKQKGNFEKPRNYLMNNIWINIIMNSNTTVKANPMGMLLNTSVSTAEWTAPAIYVEQYWQQTRNRQGNEKDQESSYSRFSLAYP